MLVGAERSLRNGDNDAAFVALMQIFSQPHDAFTPILSGKPSYSTYRSAIAVLKTADFVTRSEWTQTTEALAAQALREATAGGAVEALRGVSRRFPFTRSGMESLALRTTLALNRGQVRLARAIVGEMEYFAATAVSFPTADLLGQFRHRFKKHRADAAPSANTVSVVGQTDVPRELSLPWPEPLWQWKESVWENSKAVFTLAPLLQPEQRRELAANSWSPLITPDAVILRTPFRIVSFRRATGEIHWVLPTDTVSDDVRLEDTREYSPPSRDTIAHLLSREEVGSMAVDEDFLFFVDRFRDFGNQVVRRQNSAAGGLNPRDVTVTDNGRAGTRLVAVQMKLRPHVAWTVGSRNFAYRIHSDEDDTSSVHRMSPSSAGESAEDAAGDLKPEFHGRRFLGVPLVYDRMLFVLSTDEEVVWLSCLTQATGRTIWQRPLTYENVPVPRYRSRFILVDEPSGISLCGIQGDTLICAVNGGVVIGTRLVDGQFKWATNVRDADNSANSGRPSFLSQTKSRTRSCFRPLFRDGKMVWASEYSTMIHCIDTDSGKILWQADRNVAGVGRVEGSSDRYAVAVLQDSAVLVGNRHVRALNMSDGTQLWITPIQEQTGRGTCNGAQCVIPLQDGTITQIDMSTGRTNRVSQAMFSNLSDAAVGSLVADDEIICAATPLSVSVFPTIQSVRQRAVQPDSLTSQEQLVRAKTELLSSDLEKGVAGLESLLSDDMVGPQANEILAETLLLLLAGKSFEHAPDVDTVPSAMAVLDRLALTEEQQIRRFLLGSARMPSLKGKAPRLTLLPDWEVRADVAAWTDFSGDHARAVAPFSPDEEPRLSFATIEHAILFPQQIGDVASQVSFAKRLVDSHYPTAAHLFLLAAAQSATDADRLQLESSLPAGLGVRISTGETVAIESDSGAGAAERRPSEIKIEETLSLSTGSRLVRMLSMEKGTVETPDWFSDRLFRTSKGVVSVNMEFGAISAPTRLPMTAEILVPPDEFQSMGIIPLNDDRHVGVMSLVPEDGSSLLWWKRIDRDVTNGSPIQIGPVGPGYLVVATGNQISCLHPFTGSVLWKRTVFSDLTPGFGESGRLIGDEQFVGIIGKNMNGCQRFRMKDGKRLDTIRLDIPAGQRPLVYGRMVLFHKDQRLVLVDAGSGDNVMESSAPVSILAPGVAEFLPRGRAVTISDDMDVVVIDLHTGRSDIRCSLPDGLNAQRITGMKAFERRNQLFVLIKDWNPSRSRLSGVSRMGETRLESGTLICIDQEAGKILWSRPAVPSVLAEIHGAPTDLLVTWSWRNQEYSLLQRQIGRRQNNGGTNVSENGRFLVVTVIDGQTGKTLAEKEFSDYSVERDEPVQFLNDAATSSISIETARSNIVISYGR
ncbi:MAG: PQQ-binding-like beta-propeller repeat protein [Fuerstiella sp.]|nr:PQQ-binding-like beta-propeller repeat protein [Fuerstiella sp.]